MDPIDNGLGRLNAGPAGGRLDRLEADVFARLRSQRARGEMFGLRLIPVQLAVSCAALLIGLFMAQLVVSSSAGLFSETIVLSEDIAPSIRLEGGGA